jgi:hypothetical protein
VRSNKDPLTISAIQDLLDYVWKRGEITKTLSGEDPQRENWERKVLNELVRGPTARILSDVAIDEAIDSGEITPWKLPNEEIDRIIDELVRRHCDGKSRYIAKIPLKSIRGETGTARQLSDTARLCLYTRREAAGYLSRFRARFAFGDILFDTTSPLGIPDVNFPVLEVTATWRDMSINARQQLEEEIANTVDLVK